MHELRVLVAYKVNLHEIPAITPKLYFLCSRACNEVVCNIIKPKMLIMTFLLFHNVLLLQDVKARAVIWYST